MWTALTTTPFNHARQQQDLLAARHLLHYGSRILSKRLQAAGIAHHYEEFDDTHSSIDYRLECSLPCLSRTLK